MRTVLLHLVLISLLSAATPPTGTATTTDLVAAGSTWKFLDNGSDAGTAWRAPSFDDSSWASGAAELGYGDGDEQTVVGFGPSSSSKYITTWFRHHFNVAGAASVERLDLLLRRDDGAVVYLNGTEVMRSNLPTGTIGYLQVASTAVSGASESAWFSATVDPALLVDGDNVVAVEIHQNAGNSSDISFDLQLRASDTAVVVTRGPYLQRATPDSVVVRWRTDVATDSRVAYGTAPTSLTQTAAAGALTTEHEITLFGLTADTTYYYSVGSSSQTLAGGDSDHSFVTPPTAGTAKATRVWVLGDSGTANADARAVRDAYDAFNGAGRTDLWLMLGDNAYDSGTDTEYQAAVFDTYPAHLRREVLWPTLGNHDAASADSATQSGVYYDIFTLPTLGEAGGVPSATEAYYSFDYGNVHFLCLDSQESSRAPGSAMLTWLADDLAASDAEWRIAFWHHPPYSKGSHNSDTESELIEMRQNVLPILESYGVDLVLTGHSHSYERSILLDGHHGLSTSLTGNMIIDGGDGRADGDGAYAKLVSPAANGGAVYVVAGSSGQISAAALNHPAMYISLLSLGSLVLDIDGSTLNAHFVDGAGAVADYFTISKVTPTPGPTSTPTPSPTGTSTPTPTPTAAAMDTPSPTGTPTFTPATHHDSVILPIKPILISIPAGSQEIQRSLRIKVSNADISPNRESPGHNVRLTAVSSDCPGSTIDGAPDFDTRSAGDQDQRLIAGGMAKRATLRLRLRADEFTSHNPNAPQRCSITLIAATELPGDEDPTPANNRIEVEINVLDGNDLASTAVHESTIDSLAPLKLTIRAGRASATKTARVLLGNADSNDSHAVALAVTGGDCPAGTVSVAAGPVTIGAGNKLTAELALTPSAGAFHNPSRKSPHRCTAEITASTDVDGNSEPDESNNISRLVIDVDDRNDY